VKSLRIVHVASVVDVLTKIRRGGRGQLIYLLARKQADEGHDVTVIAAPSSRIEKCYTISFVNPPKPYRNKVVYYPIRRLKETEHSIKAYKWLGSNYDIIHNHIEFEGVAFSFLNKTPSITTLHGPLYSNPFTLLLTKLYSVPRRTKFVTYSKYTYTQFKKIYGDDLIGYVYGGVNVDEIPFVSKPIKSCDLQLCWVGRIVPTKGAHIAIAVADRLHKQGHDVHLKLVGTLQHTCYKYFCKILHKANKRPYVSVKVNATKEEVAKSMGNSDVTLFPILWDEPFGFVMIESMACGTPVLAFPRGATPEIIQNGLNGFLCNNITDMVYAILDISKINRRKCRQIARERFGVDTMYRGYLKMYERILEADG